MLRSLPFNKIDAQTCTFPFVYWEETKIWILCTSSATFLPVAVSSVSERKSREEIRFSYSWVWRIFSKGKRQRWAPMTSRKTRLGWHFALLPYKIIRLLAWSMFEECVRFDRGLMNWGIRGLLDQGINEATFWFVCAQTHHPVWTSRSSKIIKFQSFIFMATEPISSPAGYQKYLFFRYNATRLLFPHFHFGKKKLRFFNNWFADIEKIEYVKFFNQKMEIWKTGKSVPI